MDSDDVETLLRLADEALYAAKHAGRDRVLAWSPAGLAAADTQPERVHRTAEQALLDADFGDELETDEEDLGDRFANGGMPPRET
jgi:predicted signal transduction protein with EAL and GGDEF domain